MGEGGLIIIIILGDGETIFRVCFTIIYSYLFLTIYIILVAFN